ncbi:hypothetical protein TNCV_1356381 [Trichonephila clavipes]|uniref:Uncharacterized protein n=1 Tax=Trichonephila clavipes TaxID=2585209 RepID=A0A8X6V7X8_TRICX|nr:hypothetical protein TNCV_1356381 [Trichonephila clavipes]
MAPFRLQPVKLLQVNGKLVRHCHGAVRNVLMHILMQRVWKDSVANVFEFVQRLQGHMANNTQSSWNIFCCSVPLTTMKPPRPSRHNLPLA